MGSFSLVHWIVVIVILLLVFGPKRLSEVGKGLGQGIKNFKRGLEDKDKDDETAEEDAESRPKKLKGESAKQKQLTARVSEDAADDDEGDDEPVEERPKKKARRA